MLLSHYVTFNNTNLLTLLNQLGLLIQADRNPAENISRGVEKPNGIYNGFPIITPVAFNEIIPQIYN